MQEQVAVQALLREHLVGIQKQNPRYSLRAYAQKVGIHVGALTHILNGKRNVSRKLAERIATRLLLDPQQRSELLRLFPDKTPYRKASQSALSKDGAIPPRYLELSAAQYKISAEWEHFALLSLIKCKDFESKPEWISQRLGITKTRAQQVIDRLLFLGLVHLDADGHLARSPQNFRTPDDVADLCLKKHHDQTLELAREALYDVEVSKRDFTTLTLAIDPNKISMAKELIRKFQDELSDRVESGHLTEVYRLSMQLFPLTRLQEVKKGNSDVQS